MDTVFKIEPQSNELTIRSGQASTIKDPVPINISGQITAPKIFYLARKDDQGGALPGQEVIFSPGTCHLIVNRKERQITLIQGDQSFFKNVVTGTLRTSKEFEALWINQDKSRSPKELAKVLRRYQYLFPNKEEGMKIVSDLMSFNGTVKAQVENTRDDRGNRKNSVTVSVESNIPIQFDMTLPIFEGMGKARLRIEILLEAQGQSVDCFLQSLEAFELVESETDRIIDEEVKPFNEAGIPVIEV